ncbi:D-alanyl-D-alanine carboxypeptidase family protein [Cellulomonas sp. Marseille-Q8402]
MTTRPQHVRGSGPGAHRRGRAAGRRVTRAAQIGSVVLLGGFSLAFATQSAGTASPSAGSAEPAGAPRPSATTPATDAASDAVTRSPVDALLRPGAVDPLGDPLASPRRTPDAVVPSAPATLTPPAPAPTPAGIDLAQHATGDPASPWVVVNKPLPLTPADWAPGDLVPVAGYEVRSALAPSLTAMLAAAAADGVAVELRSGFRSAEYQAGVHAGWAERVGQARADEVSARPGHSEHQTGLAVDVGSGSRPACDFQACFDETPEGRWVAERAGEFGFLVRYTAANQAVTGYAPEGWHLRWVGTELLGELDRQGVTTLEELFGLPGGPAYP